MASLRTPVGDGKLLGSFVSKHFKAMNLLIVESPTKEKTIGNFLGKNFLVTSSYGHIRDLPRTKIGVDIENGFLPHYVIPKKSKRIVKELKEKAKKAEKVILATDEDREGEAIAWHISQVIGKKGEKAERIVFHEITKKAISEALKNPRRIDASLVSSQQARRVLDRLVGYKLSPFLWHKIAKGLSAGRVQSVALRLIVEREEEIKKFKPEEYWTIEAVLEKGGTEFKAKIFAVNGKNLDKLAIRSKEKAEEIIRAVRGREFVASKVAGKIVLKKPSGPFRTSSLQQESYRRLGFSSKKTMFLAQKLYEGVKLPEGRKGLITYMRTDSLNIAKEAREAAQNFVEKNFGKDYSVAGGRLFGKKVKMAQEAHEAIRPTDINLTPEKVKDYLTADENKLYDLIWRRFLSSQMKEAKIKKVEAVFEVLTGGSRYYFKSLGSSVVFDGFLKVYPQKISEEILPPLLEGERILAKNILGNQHFTQPPARYNDASLVKTLEKYGIGRPSTYVPIISTIQNRGYVKRNQNRNFFPTDIGILVNKVLVENFPKIVDYQFTAKMESDLDKISQGKRGYLETLNDFWVPFSANLADKEKTLSKEKIATEKTNLKCPLCGAPLVVKYSKYGKFLACSNFPKCKYKKDLGEKKSQPIRTNMRCPKCKEGFVVIRRTKRGKVFYGCSRYPECDWASWKKPEGLEE